MSTKFPGQRVFFASWQRARDIQTLNELLVSMSISSCSISLDTQFVSDIAKSHSAATELNVLVIGMPNVGKSTLLNALRNIGIRGRMLFCILFALRIILIHPSNAEGSSNFWSSRSHAEYFDTIKTLPRTAGICF
jgi:stage III sporulation protein SpoIIIAA